MTCTKGVMAVMKVVVTVWLSLLWWLNVCRWTPVSYFNNKIVCDLIEKRPNGERPWQIEEDRSDFLLLLITFVGCRRQFLFPFGHWRSRDICDQSRSVPASYCRRLRRHSSSLLTHFLPTSQRDSQIPRWWMCGTKRNRQDFLRQGSCIGCHNCQFKHFVVFFVIWSSSLPSSILGPLLSCLLLVEIFNRSSCLLSN